MLQNVKRRYAGTVKLVGTDEGLLYQLQASVSDEDAYSAMSSSNPYGDGQACKEYLADFKKTPN